MKSLILTALDIGSGSIKGLVGEKNQENGEIEILAVAEKPCLGIRNGEVVNPEQASLGITKVKEELANSSGVKIKEVFTNIGGAHLFSVPSQGLVSVARADQIISKDEIQRVKKEAEAINLQSKNNEILEVFPKEFIIDGEGGIKESAILGLKGIRLEVKVLLACIFSPVINNLEKAINLSGLNSLDSFITPIAVSSAVLSQEQKELGVAVLDIGFSVTSLTVFNKGEVVDFAVFPLGSSPITNDLAIGLRTEIQTAENIKKEFGTLKTAIKKSSGDKIKIIDEDMEFSKAFLKSVVESRANEIFFEAQKILKKIAGQNLPPAGIVLTGGGSLLPGIVEFAKQKTKLPCRIGGIRGVKGIENSCFATCCGVLILGFDSMESDGRKPSSSHGIGKKAKRIFKAFLP